MAFSRLQAQVFFTLPLVDQNAVEGFPRKAVQHTHSQAALGQNLYLLTAPESRDWSELLPALCAVHCWSCWTSFLRSLPSSQLSLLAYTTVPGGYSVDRCCSPPSLAS